MSGLIINLPMPRKKGTPRDASSYRGARRNHARAHRQFFPHVAGKHPWWRRGLLVKTEA